MRLPFFRRRTDAAARRLHRMPRAVRRPAENPYFNKRMQRRVVRRAPLVGAIAAVVLLLVGAVLAISFPTLNLSRIEVEGNDQVRQSDVEAAVQSEADARLLGIFSRRNFFLLRTERVRDRLSANADVASVELIKTFPDRLHVTMHERASSYAVITDDARAFADASGVAFRIFPGEGGGRAASGTPDMATSTHPLSFYISIIKERATTTYPTLYDTSEKGLVGGEEVVSERIRSACSALSKALDDLGGGLRVLGAVYDRLRQNELIAVTSEGWLVRMDPGFDISAPLNALTGVLREKVKDRTKLEYVDIRYPDRVYYK